MTTRGVDRQDIFRSDLDRNYFLKLTREALARHDTDLLTLCLMPNHVHYLLGVHTAPIGDPMHDVLTQYSVYFNGRYGRSGHLFQNRFFDSEVRDLAYLINATAYIHLNPVRAGLVRTVDEWRWSSHHELLAGGGPNLRLDRLTALTGMSPEELKAHYLERVREHVSPSKRDGLELREIIHRAAMSFGIEPEPVLQGMKGGYYTQAKKRAIDWGLEQGFSLADLAREFDCSKAAMTKLRGRS
jgi:putative transposase